MTNQVLRKLSGWVGAFACAGLLAACGGGGGSPGTNSNGQQPSKAANVVLTASAATIASSGQDGTEVTLTVIVKDGNNNALSGETVSFKSSSGNISNGTRITNSSGVVTEKLSVKGDSSIRDIEITASAGNATSNKVVVKVVQATQTLILTTDSGTLASSGAAGSEVTVTALVKDSNNSVMPGVRVDLAVDSGSLTAGTRLTDANGRVTEKLSTGGDPTSRTIKVTGSIAGLAPVSTNVTVSGTRLQVTANSTVNVNIPSDVAVKLVDSAGNALANKAVSFSSGGNSLVVKGGGPAVTNSAGALTLSYTANSNAKTSDTIIVSAMGETASTVVAISAANFTVNAINGDAPLSVADINTCVPVKVHSDNGGTPTSGNVLVGSSRGKAYTTGTCSIEHTVATPLDAAGNAILYVKATSPGISTLTANIGNGATTQGLLEFVAKLGSDATITVQSDPAVIGANTPGSSTQQASVRAIVRDGVGNLVKNALVSFTLVADTSGGALTQPSLVATGADGAASVSYVAGTAATALNGVVIRAQLQGESTASATTSLTVSKKSLFISAGTGTTVLIDEPTMYTKEFAVLVTDASGNAVPGVNITASVLPRYYRKGTLVFDGADGPWILPTDSITDALPFQCPNEDVNSNGQIDGSEDRNGNGSLQPGIPVAVTSSGTTDAQGRAFVRLNYARNFAIWLGVDLTIRGQVSGSEATYKAFLPVLPYAATDFSNKAISPPGYNSPFGTSQPYSDLGCQTPL